MFNFFRPRFQRVYNSALCGVVDFIRSWLAYDEGGLVENAEYKIDLITQSHARLVETLYYNGVIVTTDVCRIAAGYTSCEEHYDKDLEEQNKPKGITPETGKEVNMSKLEVALLVGAESKKWLADVTALTERMEAAAEKIAAAGGGGKAAKPAPAASNDDEFDGGDEAPTKTAKPAAGKKKPAASDDDGFGDEVGEGDGDDDGFGDDAAPAKAAPKKETKKYTHKDVVAACKARTEQDDRATVLNILKKQFKVTSTTDLKPEQYADVIKALKG